MSKFKIITTQKEKYEIVHVGRALGMIVAHDKSNASGEDF